jgi:hypothetical protein
VAVRKRRWVALGGQRLAQLVAFGLVDLLAVAGGGEFVGLVHDDEVPGLAGQEFPDVLAAGEVQGDQDLGVAVEEVGGGEGAEEVAAEGDEVLAEPVAQFPQPLVLQVGGDDEKGVADDAAGLQFFQDQAGHDGLAQAGVVGQEEADAGEGEDVAVDGVHLVGEEVHLGDADGVVGVKGVGQAHAGRFGEEEEGVAGEGLGEEVFPEGGEAVDAAGQFLAGPAPGSSPVRRGGR